jgi:hypothetical protein
MHQRGVHPRRGAREVADGQRIYGESGFRVSFTIFYFVIGSRVEDGVGSDRLNQAVDGFVLANIEVSLETGNYFIPLFPENSIQIGAQLPVSSK